MNRVNYFNYIELKLSELAFRLEVRGGLNLLELHLHSENFYLHFFNLLFGWRLKNLNEIDQNTAGVDLVDTTNKIVVQVSSTATKSKVNLALAKDLSVYEDYRFIFISISKDASKLRTQSYMNPHKLIFSPNQDIFDIRTLLSKILSMGADEMESIHDFLKKELKSEVDPAKVESNLSTIINILSKENWGQGSTQLETIPYDVDDKILHNELNAVRDVIDDHKIHYLRIEKIYSDFDKQGVNKSYSVLNAIRIEYIKLRSSLTSEHLFSTIIDNVMGKVQASANYTPMADEELLLCVQILSVDAFIRCKTFKNPVRNQSAAA